MLSLPWQERLHQTLRRLRNNGAEPRVALVGMGHTLYGDDGAGILLTQLLRPLERDMEGLLVVNGGSAPENCTGLLRRFMPDLVVLVDAAQLDEAPGTIQWIPSEMTSGFSASTHTLPLHLISCYLSMELVCEIVLLGIQPRRLNFGSMSLIVEAHVREMAKALEGTFKAFLTDDPGNREASICHVQEDQPIPLRLPYVCRERYL
ncbi:MAG TPA: hydrogenase 3 maturation endopeptidase HyCI [Anaerolineae bacterium]|nr:hydrogenase 3 maturation endopeptidase HyCI [Anaerolineae bacterium]